MPHSFTSLCRCLVLLLPPVLACGDGSGPNLAGCTGPVTLTATAGTVPRFSWTPRCRLFFLIVENPGSGEDQWGVISDSVNAIAPSVTYGTIPPGATSQLLAPIPLQTGVTYRATVARFTGPGHEDGVLIGQLDFTP